MVLSSLDDVERWMDSFGNAKSFDALFDLTAEFVGLMAIDKFFYMHIPPFGTHSTRDPLSLALIGFEDEALYLKWIKSRAWSVTSKRLGVECWGGPRVAAPDLGFSDPSLRHSDEDREFADRAMATIKGFKIIDMGIYGPTGRDGILYLWFHEEGVGPPENLRVIRAILSTMHVSYCRLRSESKRLASIKSPLTERERQVIILAGEGMSRKEIANALGVSESTTRSLLRKAGEKMDIAGEWTTAIVVRAIASGQIGGGDRRDDEVLLRTPGRTQLVTLGPAHLLFG